MRHIPYCQLDTQIQGWCQTTENTKTDTHPSEGEDFTPKSVHTWSLDHLYHVMVSLMLKSHCGHRSHKPMCNVHTTTEPVTLQPCTKLPYLESVRWVDQLEEHILHLLLYLVFILLLVKRVVSPYHPSLNVENSATPMAKISIDEDRTQYRQAVMSLAENKVFRVEVLVALVVLLELGDRRIDHIDYWCGVARCLYSEMSCSTYQALIAKPAFIAKSS